MTCCTGDRASRRAFLTALMGAVTAACAGPGPEASTRRERDLVRQGAATVGAAPVVDLHAHPGSFTRVASGDLSVGAIAEMRGAGVTCAFFAAVGDGPVIRREPRGIRTYRDPQPGELRRSTLVSSSACRSGLARERWGWRSSRATSRGCRPRGAPSRSWPSRAATRSRAMRVRSRAASNRRPVGAARALSNQRARRHPDRGPAAWRPHPGRGRRRGGDEPAAHGRRRRPRRSGHAARDPCRLAGARDRPHTGPAELRPFARHLSDDSPRAVAARGGVIGVWPVARAHPAPLDQFLADLRHVKGVAGIDHTAFATDMTGMSTFTAILTYPEFAAVPARFWPAASPKRTAGSFSAATPSASWNPCSAARETAGVTRRDCVHRYRTPDPVRCGR